MSDNHSDAQAGWQEKVRPAQRPRRLRTFVVRTWEQAQELRARAAALRSETMELRLLRQELLESCRQARVANRMMLQVVFNRLNRLNRLRQALTNPAD
jgi:hypothetical protein